MQPDRWQELKQELKQKFTAVEEYQEDLEHGEQEVLEFVSPLGKVKLCLVKKPKILEKKTSYSNRIGSSVSVEYVYDPENFSYHLDVWLWSEPNNQWEKLEKQDVFS